MSPNQTANTFAIIFVLGPPGAGKSTLCAHLANSYALAHYSVGDGLRQWMRENADTPFAAVIRDKLENQGFLDPKDLDPFVQNAIKAVYREGKSGILIDGFPRLMGQLESFEGWAFGEGGLLDRSKNAPDIVLVVRTSKDKARERYIARSRDVTDGSEKFERRFAEYERETLPVEESFRDRGTLVEVEADGTKEENAVKMEEVLGESELWKGSMLKR